VRDTLAQTGLVGVGPAALVPVAVAGALVVGCLALLVVPVPAVAGAAAERATPNLLRTCRCLPAARRGKPSAVNRPRFDAAPF
jgi:hypothetical protein